MAVHFFFLSMFDYFWVLFSLSLHKEIQFCISQCDIFDYKIRFPIRCRLPAVYASEPSAANTSF